MHRLHSYTTQTNARDHWRRTECSVYIYATLNEKVETSSQITTLVKVCTELKIFRDVMLNVQNEYVLYLCFIHDNLLTWVEVLSLLFMLYMSSYEI